LETNTCGTLLKRKNEKADSNKKDESFEKVWHERLVGLQSLFSKSDKVVDHGVIPFYLDPLSET
jgi:hypothetical protein